MQTVGPGLWRENRKTWKTRHKHCMTLNLVRNTEKLEKRKRHNAGFEIWQED